MARASLIFLKNEIKTHISDEGDVINKLMNMYIVYTFRIFAILKVRRDRM